ncbi:hypothetical protein OG784_32305 [Streptomyces sp. NBC_01617]|uniref:hypothetical protein n=1 Tax=unclassified Streptomyces TaxID=2593676 RepID=UPI0038671BAA|nr:hypothetical protein OG987_32465 [Streptomyces sp. NBC_01620]WTE63122.1 hypothetical protein OG784_32305 [Streptomyces sp. NBC_01617]
MASRASSGLLVLSGVVVGSLFEQVHDVVVEAALGVAAGGVEEGSLGFGEIAVQQLDEEADGSWYAQVLLRDNNTYQLEYRDGVAAEHYQTRTVSQEKVLAAMLGWAAGRRDWRDALMWNNIGLQFETGAAPPLG